MYSSMAWENFKSIELADALDQGRFKESLPSICGICYMAKEIPTIDYVECPSYEAIKADKMDFADAFRIQYDEQDPFYGRIVVQNMVIDISFRTHLLYH